MVSFSIFLPRLLHLVIMSEDRARDGEMSPTASGRGAATKGSMRPPWPVVTRLTSVTPHYVFIGAETRRYADTSRYPPDCGDQIREFLKKLGDCCD